MKNNNRIFVARLVVLVAVGTGFVGVGFVAGAGAGTDIIAGAGVSVGAEAASTASAGPVTAATVSETTDASAGFIPKKLMGKDFLLLDRALGMNPIGILRIDLANRSARVTLDELSSAPEDKKILNEKMEIVLKPLKQFFGDIQTYSFMVIPLIEESLFGAGASVASGTPEQRAEVIKKSMLLQFLESKTNDVSTFFEEQIKCKNDLKRACTEVLTFFADLKASLSEKTLKKYHEFIAELKKPKAKL